MGKTAGKVSPLSKDEMILRYFAGCDSLEFNPRGEYDVPYTSVTYDETKIVESEQEKEIGKEKIPAQPPTQKEVPNETPAITFYSVFYYPNNYAAEDYNNGTKSGGPTAALDLMFESGKRSNESYGYELGQGGTGMTYNGQPYYTGKDKNGTTRQWFYPVDNRVNNEVLRNKERYKDMQDYGLNASFYGDFWSDASSQTPETIQEYLNNGNTGSGMGGGGDLETAKSLVRLENVENKYFVPSYNFYKNLKDVVTKLKNSSNNQYHFDIEIQGFASSHGYVPSNKILAENRADVIERWIRSLGVFDFENGDKISHNGNGQISDTGANNGTDSESDFRPKAARAAVVTFKIIPPQTVVITEEQQYAEYPIVEIETATSITSESGSWEKYDTSASDDYENQTYDDEYTYFKQINENDDMVKRYISDKVDYFDPAFHSITPEGFNARLTFLQQCTRQGPTISASDLQGGSAYGAGNLSFGRPPFCVLRIGDFFNTKICIQNININYDVGGGVQWDLNPEGVGLQPMIADVNITFTFLGGSDISGPISRLQNAVSYNYYANTSVYDRRADYRENYVTEENDEAMTWSPVILNKDENKNVIEHVPFRTRPTRKAPNNE